MAMVDNVGRDKDGRVAEVLSREMLLRMLVVDLVVPP